MRGMSSWLRPPEKTLAEQWEEIKKNPWRHLIAALILFGLLAFSLTDLAIRLWQRS